MDETRSTPQTTTQPTSAFFEALRKRATIEKFDGSDRLPVEIWINVFEQITEGMVDHERINLLPTYLERDAFRWYAQFVTPHRNTLDWTTARRMMRDKFTKTAVKPIIAANQRVLRQKETVQQYFDDKTRLLELANIPEDVMIDLLTDGLPDSYRIVVSARQPRTLSEWLACVTSFEGTRRNDVRQMNVVKEIKEEPRPHSDRRNKKPNRYPEQGESRSRREDDDPPPSPCPRCLAQGKTEMHWASKCLLPRPTKSRDQTSSSWLPQESLNSKDAQRET
jgi:hypothetical protein